MLQVTISINQNVVNITFDATGDDKYKLKKEEFFGVGVGVCDGVGG